MCGMRAWLIVNPASGSVSRADAIDAEAEAAGIDVVGRSVFPVDPLPDPGALHAQRVELVILFAGDGTINAAACALDRWAGRVLILPGGTMNMLAKRLHGDSDAATILARAGADPAAIPLPYVEAGPHRAFVAMIVGPPSAWAHAREAVRHGRIAAALRAARLAWLRSFAGGVRLRGSRRGVQRALVVTPDDRGMEVAAIGIEGWLGAIRLGAQWLAGDWRDAPSVRLSRPDRAEIIGSRSIHLMFDGETVKLAAPIRVSHGMSRLRFLRTLKSEPS